MIKDSEINANPTTGSFAFDVCRYASYTEVHVTVTGNSTINGDVEVYASGSDPKDGFSLKLMGGELTGNIVLDATAQAAMASSPENTEVTKADSFNQATPEGYAWVSNNDGTSSLQSTSVAQIGSTKYQTLEAAFAAAADGATITLLKDCAGNGIQVLPNRFKNTGLTVDFNGHTYTMDGEMVGSTGTETQAFQLLKDNTITFKNGTIYSENARMLVQNYSDLTLDNMTLTLDNPNYAYAYTLSNNNGNVVIDATTINANPAGAFAFDVCRYASYPSVNVTVKGESVINGNVEVSASGSDAKDGFKLTLEEGTLNGDIVLDATAQAAMAATPDKAEVTKKDTFSQDAPEGYAWIDNGNGTSSLRSIYVAQIGDVKYETLEAAFAAATDGATITLLQDCAGNGIKAPEGKFKPNGLTVDFDGHTYTVDGSLVGSTGTVSQAFQLLKYNKITFKNGTIYSENARMLVQNYSDLTLDNMTLTLDNPNYAYAYTLSNNNGNTVIKDSKITANPAGGYAFDVCRYSSYPSVNVTVTGTSEINGNVEVYASNGDAKDGFSLTLESGTLNGDIVLDATAQTAMAATPEKAEVTKADTFDQDPPEDYKWKDNGDGTSTLVPRDYVAQIGTKKYESLYEAVQAATEGQTVVMIADHEETATSVVNKAITIDLNGKTVSGGGSDKYIMNVSKDLLITDNSENGGGIINGSVLRAATVTEGATVTVKDATVTATQIAFFVNNGNLIINDATVSSGAATVILNSGDVTLNSGNLVGGSDVGIVIQYAGNFTMNGGKITGNGSGIRQQAAVNNGKIIINGGEIETKGLAIWPAGHGCELTINDGTITSTNNFAIAMNGSANYNGGTTVNIKGGTMNGGIYSPNQDAVLNITGGNITAKTGITMKGGTLNISDGTVTGTGDYKEPAAASSGATETGAAIYVEDTYSAQGEGDFKPTVNITDGTFVSEHSYAVLFFTDKTTENYPYGGINIDYGVFVSPMADQTIKQVLPAGLDLKAIKIANGWYTEAIPAEYCVDGVEPDPNPRADAPDTRAQYTVLSTNEIILIDGEAYPYPGGIRAPKVIYRRTFSNSQVDKYQAWIVPMDYTLSDGDTQDFDFYKIHMIAASGDETGGLIDDNQPIYIYIEKLAAGRKISANLPYIVKPKSAGEFDFVVVNATLKADDHSRRLFMSTSEWNYEFYANYAEEMGATAANQWYAMSGGQICPNKNENAVLGSYRWYIKVTDNEFNDVDYAPHSFIFEENSELTGINQKYIFDENELEGIYTIDGVKQESVTKGVNILRFKNGTTKKVYVK